MESNKSHLPAFSSTTQDNKPGPTLSQDCWRVPGSSRTAGCSFTCPVWGIITFKGLQFLSTRVARRHYTILERLLNQQRISTSAVAAASGGSPRGGKPRIPAWGLAQGLILCSCITQDEGGGGLVLGPLCRHGVFPVLSGTGLWAHTAQDSGNSGHRAQFASRRGQPPVPGSGGWEKSSATAARRPPTRRRTRGPRGAVSREPQRPKTEASSSALLSSHWLPCRQTPHSLGRSCMSLKTEPSSVQHAQAVAPRLTALLVEQGRHGELQGPSGRKGVSGHHMSREGSACFTLHNLCALEGRLQGGRVLLEPSYDVTAGAQGWEGHTPKLESQCLPMTVALEALSTHQAVSSSMK